MNTIEEHEHRHGIADRIIERLGPMLTAERVFGTAVERDGVTVIPVASYRAGGGGGGGEGHEAAKTGSGEGGGFGAVAKPAGVYVITRDGVEWKPAVSVDQIISTTGIVVAMLIFFRWRSIKAKARLSRRTA